jgi:predicted metallo-beta-lactamase superfamily hydrolase
MGLRLEDVEKYGLESEFVSYGKTNPVRNLMENGATEAEISFLCDSAGYKSSGRRVEINALGSRNLLNLIESKFKEHGVKKIVPDHETLEDAYYRSVMANKMNEKLEEIVEEIKEKFDKVKITPKQIEAKVKRIIKKTPTKSWDDAVAEIARGIEWPDDS